MRKSIISAIALGSLAAVALLCAAGPAAAAAVSQQQCNKKYLACQQHCFDRYKEPASCIQRTCNKQYDNCVANTGTGGSNAQTSGNPLTPKGGPRGPLGGGIKDEPKSPPKVNDTRAPLGGGVLGQSSASGSGANGTILKSAGGRR
jgi:hypothetical protein